MLEIFVRWMAHHSRTKITMKIEYHDGTYKITTIDYLGHSSEITGSTLAQNEAADGQSQLTEVLDTPTCAIGGVFRLVRNMGVCRHHGCGNRCHYHAECEHKRVANA